jgi:hypothetical protein
MSWKDWKTNPILADRMRALSSSVMTVRSAPSSHTRPEAGRSSPARRPSRVVLPLPEGPTMARKLPSSRAKVISFNTVRGRPPER